MNCLFAHEEMATAQELTRIVDRLEERVGNHITFGKWIGSILIAWLLAGSGLLLSMRSDLSVLTRPQKLSGAASNPTSPKSQAQALKIIAASRKESVPLPQTAIQQAGQSFIDASPRDQKAWNVALDFVSYRTNLNNRYAIGSIAPLPPGKQWDYGFSTGFVPGKPKPGLNFSQNLGVPADEAARFDLIGRDANSQIPVGPAFLVLHDGAYNIDNHHIKSMFFKGVEVHYTGAPVILENVVFIDCTFVMDNNDASHMLASEVLSDAKVTFAI